MVSHQQHNYSKSLIQKRFFIFLVLVFTFVSIITYSQNHDQNWFSQTKSNNEKESISITTDPTSPVVAAAPAPATTPIITKEAVSITNQPATPKIQTPIKAAVKPSPPQIEPKATFNSTWKLPFKPGAKIYVDQGYDSNFSHKGRYALDFVSKNATSVLASRTGIVTVIANGGKWDKWCQSSQDCSDKGQIWNGNHISIQHSDGTIAKYLHFKAGSMSKSLKVGSKVNQGDFLGIMGSTGYTCLTRACTEPDIHLHFEVQSNTKKETIPTPFYECNQKVNKCTTDGWLIQDNNYFN